MEKECLTVQTFPSAEGGPQLRAGGKVWRQAFFFSFILATRLLQNIGHRCLQQPAARCAWMAEVYLGEVRRLLMVVFLISMRFLQGYDRRQANHSITSRSSDDRRFTLAVVGSRL